MSESDTLVSEPDALVRWPVLSKSKLRIARHTGAIAWVRGKRGAAWYRPSAIETYIQKELERPCRDHVRDPSSSLEANGSQKTTQDQTNFIGSGLSQELAERAAQASVQKIFAKQK